jgi:hypothetical protein
MSKKLWRAHVVAWWMVARDGSQDDPDAPEYRCRILAEGDSWFTLGGIPTSNLLFSLEFPHDTIIVNCAKPGDTIRRMAEMSKDRAYRDALSRKWGSKWDLILLSGGGNDLIDDADDIILPKARRPGAAGSPADYCSEPRIRQLIKEVQAGYRKLVALRDAEDSPARHKPVVTHIYDWPTPRNSPARFLTVPLLGPWLYPAMKDAEVPEADWPALSDYLLGRLGDAILELQDGPDPLPNFHVVNTRDTLRRAAAGHTGDSNDWLNEIHPNYEGYKKLAKKIGERMRALLPAS